MVMFRTTILYVLYPEDRGHKVMPVLQYVDGENVPAFLEVIFNHLWLCMVHYKHQPFSICLQ